MLGKETGTVTIKMAKDTKIVHITVADSTPEQVMALKNNLKQVRENLPFDVEFLVTNDKVELRDVGWLIKELVALYKMNKEKK